jgi:hypothetical protein
MKDGDQGRFIRNNLLNLAVDRFARVMLKGQTTLL